MKAERNIPKKCERPESLSVEPSKQPAPEPFDLRELPALRALNDTLEKLYQTPEPSITDCEDASLWAYKQASTLLTYVELAEKGMHFDGSDFPEPKNLFVTESIQLQLDIMRLASERLYSLGCAKECAVAQAAKVA
jgi:hypothetical protein